VDNNLNINRRVIDTRKSKYDVYQFEGPKLDNIGQLDLTYDNKTGHGAYMIRMEPGAETTAHKHTTREEYLVIEGDLIEPGGLVLGPGDYVIYEPGSEHSSRTVNGCLLVGFDSKVELTS
jgi:anti-sigma factor ChrR (cupin superfamily)